MKYIIFNWKSYLNISESMNLSKVVSKLPSTKKYKLISSPNNFYNLTLKSRYPKNIYAAQNVDLHGKGASTGSIDIQDLVSNKIKFCIWWIIMGKIKTNIDKRHKTKARIDIKLDKVLLIYLSKNTFKGLVK